MTAQETSRGPSVTQGESTEVRHKEVARIDKWSIAWLLLTLALWGLLAFLLLASYGPEVEAYPGVKEGMCKGPLLARFPRPDDCLGDQWRQWPALLGVTALAVISTVVAAATTVYAKVLSRLTHQTQARP
ncbi:hypothetical protein GCM10010510_08360 [Streptomyces anandii JCM 4720]|nr:hypothetical protein GCM10010510_08360 [Streptomyces anandii JCM 4720]